MQEKAISFPTDVKLMRRARERVVRLARAKVVALRHARVASSLGSSTYAMLSSSSAPTRHCAASEPCSAASSVTFSANTDSPSLGAAFALPPSLPVRFVISGPKTRLSKKHAANR